MEPPQRIAIFLLLILRINFPSVGCAAVTNATPSRRSAAASSFFPSVIINNKPVSFREGVGGGGSGGDESDTKSASTERNDTKNKLNQLILKSNITQQKSNVYKPTNFITKDSRLKYGLITKDNLKWYFPKETHIAHNSIRPPTTTTDRYESSQLYYGSYTPPQSPPSPFTTTTTQRPQESSYLSGVVTSSPAPPTIHYGADYSNAENSLKDTYHNEADDEEELQYSMVPIQTTATTQGTLASLSFALSTPTPATIVIATPATAANGHNKGNDDGNQKKKKKKKNKVTASPQIHKHFIENLDYYRKILQINCTGNSLAKNGTSSSTTAFSDSGTVVVTPKPQPKPNKVKNNDKYIYEVGGEEQKDKDDHKDDKKKCKCKKKHHHHDDHHHHHHGHHHHHHKHSKESKESHEHKPVYYATPQTVLQHTVPVQTVQTIPVHGAPQTFNHVHQHKVEASQVVPQIIKAPSVVLAKPSFSSSITSPDKLEYFDASRLPPAPLGEEYEEVGSMFDSFYKAIENAFTADPPPQHDDDDEVDYQSRDDYENESEDESESEEEEEDEEGATKAAATESEDESESEEEEDESEEDYKKRRKRRDVSTKLETKSKKMRAKKRNATKIATTAAAAATNKTKPVAAANSGSEEESEEESSSLLSMMPQRLFDVLSNLFAVESGSSSSSSGATAKSEKKSKALPVKAKYTNHQLWRLALATKRSAAYVEEFIRSEEGMKFHWLNAPRAHGSVDVVVPLESSKSFRNHLDEGAIQFSVEIYNVQHAMRLESPRLRRKQANARQAPAQRYYTVSDHHAHYKLLKKNYPNYVDLIEIGRSTNDLPLIVVKVSHKGARPNSRYAARKPAIFIQSGGSPHLWLLVASSNHILRNLLMHITDSDSFGNTIRKFDWYIYGLANPDGYEYSMHYDRLWQKTRSQQEAAKDSKRTNIMMSTFSWFIENSPQKQTCYGVHYSRNFDSHWMLNKASSPLSSSSEEEEDEEDEGNNGRQISNNNISNQCSDFYPGQFPSSEPEVKSLSDFLMRHQTSIQLFINLEGYGQRILYPSRDLGEDAVSDLNDMARAGLRNIKMHRSVDNKYEISRNDTHIAFGTPESFALYKAGIKYSYRIEGSEALHQSIFVPPKSIEGTANEILDIIKGMARYLENE